MWRTLLQLRVLLPYLPRLLHLVSGTTPPPDTKELRAGVTEVQSLQLDLRRQVQEQSVGLKRLEEQILRLREEAERQAVNHADALSELKAAADKLRTLAFGGLALLTLTVLLLGAMLGLLIHRLS